MRTTTEVSGVCEKIKKLLAMAEGGTEHEAQIASAKAKALLDRHGMTLTDVEIMTAEMQERAVETPRRGKDRYHSYPTWQQLLMNAVMEGFMVSAVYHGDGKLGILGAKEDVAVAHYVWLYLVRQCERLSDSYMAQYRGRNLRGSFLYRKRNGYRIGFVTGVYKKLQMESRHRATTADGTELVVVKGAAANRFCDEKYPDAKEMEDGNISGDSDAIRRGLQAGLRTQIKRGIQSEEEQRALE